MAVVRSVTVLSSRRDEAEDLIIVRYPPIAGIDDEGRDREIECGMGRHGALVPLVEDEPIEMPRMAVPTLGAAGEARSSCRLVAHADHLPRLGARDERPQSRLRAATHEVRLQHEADPRVERPRRDAVHELVAGGANSLLRREIPDAERVHERLLEAVLREEQQ